ncbi:MAG: hypothetical protein ABII27_07040 [bacterium]
MDKKRWSKLSKAQQLGNIGSEIARANYWEMHDDDRNREKAFVRSLELLDLTLSDQRWKSGLKEIARFREVVSALFCKHAYFDISTKELENYCIDFVINSKKSII